MVPSTRHVNAHLSASRLKKWAQCPKAFELHYIRKLPTKPNPAFAFGSALHLALERTYRLIAERKLTGRFPEDDVVRLWQDAWREEKPGDLAIFEEGLAILKAYARAHAQVDHESVLAIEQEFRLPVGRFTVLGFIDRVDKLDDETVRIVDYKSNRVVFTRDEVDHDLQLSIYALAARMLWPWAKNVRLAFYLLRHGFYMETERAKESLDATRAYVEALGEQTESATEFPARVTELCAYCDHASACPAYHRALLGQVDLVCRDESDLEAVAREREEVAAKAKLLYARKDALERVLKAHIQKHGRVELGGVAYSIATTTQLAYPTEPTLDVLTQTLGRSREGLAGALLSVDKAKLDALLDGLSDTLRAADVRMLKTQLQAVAEKTLIPRFGAQRVRTPSPEVRP
jgi:RecB family exonuclease